MFKAGAIMVLAMLFIPLGDTAGKLLTSVHTVQPVFVAWSRFVLGFLMIFCLMGGRGFQISVLRDWRFWFRGGLVTCAIVSILTALKTVPISDVFAAFFIGPIISYFISAWLLGEAINKTRTLLLFIGFCGVLLVVKPGINVAPGMGFAILAGLFYGSFLVASKWLAHTCTSKTLLLSQLLIGSLFLFPWGIQAIPTLSFDVFKLILLSASASAIGNFLLIVASQRADASRLAPLVYFQLISATALGIYVFKEFPDIYSLIGLALLLSTGLGSFFISKNVTINQQKP